MRLEIEVWDKEHWEVKVMDESQVMYHDVIYWTQLEGLIAELKLKYNF